MKYKIEVTIIVLVTYYLWAILHITKLFYSDYGKVISTLGFIKRN